MKPTHGAAHVRYTPFKDRSGVPVTLQHAVSVPNPGSDTHLGRAAQLEAHDAEQGFDVRLEGSNAFEGPFAFKA